MKGPNAWLALQYRISVNIIQFHITYAIFYSIPFHSILFYSIVSIKLQVQSHLKKTCFNMYLHTKRSLKVCLWCCICVHENVNVTRITCKPRVLYSGCWFGTSSKHVASHIAWSPQFPQNPTPCPVHLYNLCYTGRKGHYNIFWGIVFSIQLWHEGIYFLRNQIYVCKSFKPPICDTTFIYQVHYRKVWNLKGLPKYNIRNI